MVADTFRRHLKEMVMKTRLSALLAVVTLCSLLALPSPALATPDFPVEINGASLEAKGRLVIVDLTFTCVSYESYRIDVLVRQGWTTGLNQGRGYCVIGETVSESFFVEFSDGITFDAGSVEVNVSVTQFSFKPPGQVFFGDAEAVVEL